MKRPLLFGLLALFSTTPALAQNDDDDNINPPTPAPQGTPPPPPAQLPPPPSGQQQYRPSQPYPQQQQYPYGQYPQNGYQQYPQQYRPQQYPQQYPQQRPPTGYQQQPGQYPQQYPYGQYPQNGYQQYPYGQYPQYQQYPQRDAYGRPIPPPPGYTGQGQQPSPQMAPIAQPMPQAAFVLTTTNEAARADALACADALENYHLDTARQKCADALAKDDSLAMAHLWMSMAANSPTVAAAELARASELGARASQGERLYIGGWRAWRDGRMGDARSGFDQLCASYPGEKRAFLRRGLFRQVVLGDLDGAVADYRKAIALDEKYGAAQNFLGFALADQGKVDEAENALKKYAALAPNEPNALDSLATLALRMGDLGEAMAQERKAINIDPKFVVAHAVLGDALLMSGKNKDARREYAFLIAADDPSVRHEGTMRDARSWLFEDRSIDAEKAMVKEGAEARRAGRLTDAAETFVEVARIQIERGALAEAGRGMKEATETLKRTPPTGNAARQQSSIEEVEWRRLSGELLTVRAMALAAMFERDAAEGRADELGRLLKQSGDAHADDRVKVLKGWIAWKVGDDKAAIAALEKAALPSLRYAYAMALARSGDNARARTIMDELSRRTANDLDTALSRPRAAAWLKTTPTTASR